MLHATAGAGVLLALSLLAASNATAQSRCTPDQRRESLRALQARVTSTFPATFTSFDSLAVRGGPFEGYNLSHGYVVLEGMGMALVNVRPKDGGPQLLFYEASGNPERWLDFEEADPPYRLVGWGYFFGMNEPPPAMHCLRKDDWFIHEAGWHMKDGSMLITAGAESEPARPEGASGIWYWHPRAWDVHFWIDPSGDPRVTLVDEKAARGGIALPGAFAD